MRDDFIWAEKYRPKTIDDVILPDRLKKDFRAYIEKGDFPNMLLSGKPGIGKTTLAVAMCEQLDLNYIMIGGSDERNIDTLRGKVRDFASTVSFNGKQKVVIFDEADGLNPTSTQPALRGFIDEFSNNCRFIMTCNYKEKLLTPVVSRLTSYNLSLTKDELNKVSAKFWKRLKDILDKEGVEYDDQALVELIRKYAPDWRTVLIECQRYASSGKIDSGILEVLSEQAFDKLAYIMKNKNFKEMVQWVATYVELDQHLLFRGVYDHVSKKVKPESIPQMVLILADYQHKAAFVADQEINMVACLTEIMSSVQFK